MAPALFHACASLTIEHTDIWRLNLADLQQHETALRALLTRHEIESISSRPRALTRATLRLLLGTYLECLPEAIQLRTGIHGKPSLDCAVKQGNGRDIRFSLSRSDEVALVAVALECELGVDLECLRRVPGCLAIARRYFSSTQYEQLREAPPEKRCECFLRLWCCHEAKEKLSGYGIQLLGTKPRMSRKKTSVPETRDISWQERDGEEYVATLATAASMRQLRHWTLP